MPLDDLGRTLFLFLFGIMVSVILVVIPLWIILTVYTPRSLLDRYFKEPHFTLAETIMMSQFPGSFMRTSIFAWLLLLQPFGFKTTRKMSHLEEYMPKWYEILLKFFVAYSCFAAISILILFASIFGIAFYTGKL